MRQLIDKIPDFICDEGDTSYILYSDTDSIYSHAVPYLKHKFPNYDSLDDKVKDNLLEKVALKFQDIVTKDYDNLAANVFYKQEHYEGELEDSPLHRIEMKTECVIRSAYFRATRRYAQWITKQEGIEKETLDIKGLEFMNTNFPKIFNDFFYDILKRILEGATQQEILDDVTKFKSDIINGEIGVKDLGNPTSVKGIEKYIGRQLGTKCFSEVKKGSPASYRAAIYYNDMLRLWGEEKKYELITNGSKIRWVYLIDNPYRIEALAFNPNKIPPKIMEFLQKYTDRRRIYRTILENKLEGLFGDLGWSLNTNQFYHKFFKK